MPGNNLVLSEVGRLHALGFAVLWLREKSKVPAEAGWTSGERKSLSELLDTRIPNGNVGVRLGKPSKLKNGYYLAVIDVDVKSLDPKHRREAIRVAKSLGDVSKAPMVKSGRGNGSRHYYIVTENPAVPAKIETSKEKVKVYMPSAGKPSKLDLELLGEAEIKVGYRIRPAWEVAVMGTGQQTVLPPSIHPDSGNAYEWVRPLVKLTDLPVLAVRTALSAEPEDEGFIGAASRPEPVITRLDGFNEVPVELGWLPISSEMYEAIVKGTGVEDRSAYLMRASSALFSAGLSRDEVLSVLTNPDYALGAVGYEHAKTDSRKRAAEWVHRYTVKGIAKDRLDGAEVFRDMPVACGEVSEGETVDDVEHLKRNWRQELDRTKDGKIRTSLKNLDLILSNSVQPDLFVKDVFSVRIEHGAKCPWGPNKGDSITDGNLISIKRWLADTEFQIEPSVNLVLEAVGLIADRNSRHPVRDYLNALEWDGVKRIDTWVRDYCQGQGTEPYLSEASRKFLLAMIKRVFEPGCQWDYTLILESAQGKMKSTLARTLAGDKWFMDNLPDLRDKDSMLNLQGKWLVELAELANIKGADLNAVKAYLSRRTDTVRAPYGRMKEDFPRQCVFFGTVNEGQYLKDPTGNRRYWPVKVGLCDVKGLSKVRDQLFAEAMHLYRTTSEILALSPKAERQAKFAQDDRRVEDEETEMRDLLISFRESELAKDFDFSRFKMRDLMVGPSAPWGHYNGRGHTMNVGAHVLGSLGYFRRKIEGQRYWGSAPKGRKSPDFR